MKLTLDGNEYYLTGMARVKGGMELSFNCPKCKGKGKLQVNLKKKMFHCYRCSWGGVLIVTDAHVVLTKNTFEKELVTKLHQTEIEIPGFIPFYETPNETGYEAYHYMVRRCKLANRSWGISTEYRLRDMLIIPIIEDGKEVCYVARAINGERLLKELSPPSSVANRSHFLYNIDSIKPHMDVIVVEGIFDCEAVSRAGFACVAAMGSHLSEIQIGKLLAKNPYTIKIMFDSDDAGVRGRRDAIRDLLKRNFYKVTWVGLPEGRDPDELSEEELTDLLSDQ